MALFIATAKIHDGPTDRFLLVSSLFASAQTEAERVLADYDECEVVPFNEEYLTEKYNGFVMLSDF